MVERNAQWAASAMTDTALTGSAQRVWRGATIDSRKIHGGEIFFALPGEKDDGHNFVPAAIQRGAAAVVVMRDLPAVTDEEVAYLRVPDTFHALHDLTRAVRAQVPKKLAAITGSAGKTTTKELLATLLRRRFKTERSLGNFNNLYGFPLSLLNIGDDCEWMVAEMGMSTPGELRQVSQLGCPDMAIFTNVRPVHLMNFADLRGIAEAKAELLAGLAQGGWVVVNADDPEVMGIAARHAPEKRAQVVRYGFQQPADVVGRDLAPLDDGRIGSRFRLVVGRQSQEIELPLHGLYNAENFLAAAAAAHTLGVSLEEIAMAAGELQASPMRGEVHRLPNGSVWIDDCYNSNPDAAVKALESARAIGGKRYWAFLGDMLELGDKSAAFHAEVGERAAELGFRVVGVGTLAGNLADAARRGGVSAQHFAHAEAATEWFKTRLSDWREGDVILVKGSRGVGLEVLVQAALANASGESGE